MILIFFLFFLSWAHSIRLWIFPQCLNPIQHKNNTTQPYTFSVASEWKKNFVQPSLILFFPPSNPMPVCSHLYRIDFSSPPWLCMFTFHFYTDDEKNTSHRTTTSCRSFENSINIFKWIDNNSGEATGKVTTSASDFKAKKKRFFCKENIFRLLGAFRWKTVFG